MLVFTGMMTRPRAALGFVLGLSFPLIACGKDANTQMCLDDFAAFEKANADKDNKARELAGGVYQACGISCDVTKDADACAAFEKVTKVICEKEGKAACDELCKSDSGEKNEHACKAAAAM